MFATHYLEEADAYAVAIQPEWLAVQPGSKGPAGLA